MSNYFKIARDMLEHELWLQRPFSDGQAWVDIIGLAAWKDHSIMGRRVLRGQLWTTSRYLGERWGWSPNKVFRFLCRLEGDDRVQQERNKARNTGGTLITITNYCAYQDIHNPGIADRNTNGTGDGTKTEHRRNTDGTIRSRKAGKQTTLPSPSGDAPAWNGGAFWALWVDQNRAAGLQDPVPDGPDTAAAKRLAKLLKPDTASAMIEAYLADADQWLEKQGHALRYFTGARLNMYRNGKCDGPLPMSTMFECDAEGNPTPSGMKTLMRCSERGGA